MRRQKVDGAEFAGAPIQGSPVGREIRAAGVCRSRFSVRPVFIAGAWRTATAAVGRLPVGDQLPDSVAGDEKRPTIRLIAKP